MGELHRHAIRHHPLLAAGIDEHQVFLAVVEEAEILVARSGIGRLFGLRRTVRAGNAGRRRGDLVYRAAGAIGVAGNRLGSSVVAPAFRTAVHEGLQPVERIERHALAVAQPRHELAVIDGEPAEGRFRHFVATAIGRDLRQQFGMSRHGFFLAR